MSSSYPPPMPPAMPPQLPPPVWGVPNQAGVSADAAIMMRYDANKKSALIAYLLLFFLGGLAMHRFYLGRTGSAVVMLVLSIASWVTLVLIVGAFGLAAVALWILIDAFLLPGMTEDYNNRLITRLRSGGF